MIIRDVNEGLPIGIVERKVIGADAAIPVDDEMIRVNTAQVGGDGLPPTGYRVNLVARFPSPNGRIVLERDARIAADMVQDVIDIGSMSPMTVAST